MFRSGCCLTLMIFLGGTEQPEKDETALAGTWSIKAALLAGRDHLDDFKSMKLTITGKKYEVTVGPLTARGEMILDQEKKPKWIDLTTNKDGPFDGRRLLGIYELTKDELRICLDSEAGPCPKKFEAPEKTPLMLLTYKREK